MQTSELKSFTSGEIAKFCGVTLRTVIRWIDSGKLKGYKLPGRGNNRVLQTDLLQFLNEHNMPIPSSLKNKEAPVVLIVDDELSMAKAIQRLARKAGLRSVIAENGFQAGMLLNEHKPDLMTLDLSMPGLNGFEVIKHTRANATFDQLKIVVISALPEDKLSEAKTLGANYAFPKPFEPHTLLGLFESILE
ncbi:response regulator [Agaribacter marinus]|uniref:Transcriptional regulator n=1 Tax=Agaribacter marinus TaxID=1431249 RepID=A0AA37SWU3_9ALTE|nr:response regulator [Agaribacter marinus]GLR71218.1 transcriptional regulator [Agaribacter marinus]